MVDDSSSSGGANRGGGGNGGGMGGAPPGWDTSLPAPERLPPAEAQLVEPLEAPLGPFVCRSAPDAADMKRAVHLRPFSLQYVQRLLICSWPTDAWSTTESHLPCIQR